MLPRGRLDRIGCNQQFVQGCGWGEARPPRNPVTGAAAECNQALQILQSAPYSPNLYVDYCTGNSGMPGSQWDRVISQWDRVRPERCLANEICRELAQSVGQVLFIYPFFVCCRGHIWGLQQLGGHRRMRSKSWYDD